MTFIQFVYDMEGSHMTFIQLVYDMEGSQMTFIQFVYDMEGSHMTSSVVNTRWWPKKLVRPWPDHPDRFHRAWLAKSLTCVFLL